MRPKPEVTPAAAEGLSPAWVAVVDTEHDGQRLDNFLARLCRGVPRAHVYQLIRSGQVRVDGARVTAQHRLVVGESVRVPPIRLARPALTASESPQALRSSSSQAGPPLVRLLEDDSLLVIDKPAGLAVHGGSGIRLGAIEALRRQCPDDRFLELAHRIDRETSGVLVLARRRVALLSLQQQFRERRIGKTYLAVVAGRWPLRTRTLDQPLERLAAPNGDRRVRVSADGREAITRVTGLCNFQLPDGLGEATLIAAVIETGRTHQIRVHLAHAEHPILGDDKYGDYGLNRAVRRVPGARMYLHAFRLEIDHPISGRALDLRAPLPPSFMGLTDRPERMIEVLEHPFFTKSRAGR